jgi:hypothetical protein
MQKKRKLSDAILMYSRMIELSHGDVAKTDELYINAYRKMNTFNAMITSQSKLHILCYDAIQKSNALDSSDNYVAAAFSAPVKKVSLGPIPPFPNNLDVYLYNPAIKRNCINGFNMTLTPQMIAHINWHKSYMAGKLGVGNLSRVYKNLEYLRRGLENTTLRTINAGAGTTVRTSIAIQ